jgi:hypothetical protein
VAIGHGDVRAGGKARRRRQDHFDEGAQGWATRRHPSRRRGYLIDPAELSRVYEVKPERLDAAYRPRRRTTVEATSATGGADAELATRLALAEVQVQSLKDMLAEIRQSRHDWKAQAERLALAGPVIAAAPPARAALLGPDKRRRSWRPWWPAAREPLAALAEERAKSWWRRIRLRDVWSRQR